MRRTVLAMAVPVLLLNSVPSQAQDSPASIQEAAQTPEGLVRAVYDMVSFGPGPEPDWNMFRPAFLPDALLVTAPGRTQPMRAMNVDGFIEDWKSFFRQAALADKGFSETIAKLDVMTFGGMAHAFVIFEPLVGGTDRSRVVRGLDSIDLVWDGTRWWIASITTDFEGPGKTIPPRIGGGG